MNRRRGLRWCCLSLISTTVLLTAPAECRADDKAPTQISSGSLEFVVGRDWLARRSADSQSPAASYVGVSGLIALAPSLALGAELNSSINPFGCDSDVPCYEYHLTRVGIVAESSLALFEVPEQGFEAWLELGAHATRTSLRSNAQSGSVDTTWGVGATLRGGPRVRMRRLTLSPYAEGLIMSVGAHSGAGLGLQVGLRF